MSPLYKKLGVIQLKDLYWYNMGILRYEYFHNLEFSTKLKSHFCTRSELRNSRTENNDFFFKPPKLVSTYKKPSISGSAFWNSLLSHIKEAKSANLFKSKLKNYFTESY